MTIRTIEFVNANRVRFIDLWHYKYKICEKGALIVKKENYMKKQYGPGITLFKIQYPHSGIVVGRYRIVFFGFYYSEYSSRPESVII